MDKDIWQNKVKQLHVYLKGIFTQKHSFFFKKLTYLQVFILFYMTRYY